jgi:hypothetical protein
MSESDNSSRQQFSLPRFQFSLRWLLIAVTGICVLLGFAYVFDALVLIVIGMLLWCAIPTPLVICLIYGQGDYRAFAIGALMPWVVSWIEAARGSVFSGLEVLLLMVPSLLCGILAVATRRWVARRTGP